MSLENIINRILKDAEEKADAFLKDASSKASDILKKATDEAAVLTKKILAKAEFRAKEDMERTYATKSLEIKKEILKEKRLLIARAFDEAFKVALKLDDKRYVELTEEVMIANASDGKTAEVRFSRTDRSRVGKEFIEGMNKKSGLDIRLGPYLEKDDKGFIMTKEKVILDFTFSSLFSALKDKIEFEVAKILFG